jgi:aminoglycoside 6-adenylyltransferase
MYKNKMTNSLFTQFIRWCVSNANIRAVILTSSRAHPGAVTDALSDYDLELYVNDLTSFKADDEWIEQFSPVLIRWPLHPGTTWSPDWITRLIQFTKGTRFDFQITDKPPVYHPNFDAGYKVILDKTGQCSSLPEANYSNLYIKKPTDEEFQERVNAFFWDSLYVAKSLWRDELFYAKYMLDSVIRYNSLQQFIEWYIGFTNNWTVTTNKYGRYFKKYLPPDIWKMVEKTFTGSDIDENWKGLYAMIRLAGRLCRELGAGFHYTYNTGLERDILEYIKAIQGMERRDGNS